MKLAQLPLLVAAGIFLSAAPQLSADVIYYYNSLDSNPDNFIGTLTLADTNFPEHPNSPLAITEFSMSAVVDGETLSFTMATGGPHEAQYTSGDLTDPLLMDDPYPAYFITGDPIFGGLTLVLGGSDPGPTSLGAPVIYQVPSSPVVTVASDTGEWLLTPPSSSGGPGGSGGNAPEPACFILAGCGLISLTAARLAWKKARAL
jgi:hypothetical protein